MCKSELIAACGSLRIPNTLLNLSIHVFCSGALHLHLDRGAKWPSAQGVSLNFEREKPTSEASKGCESQYGAL